MSERGRTPLKAKPRRLPGQSVREERDRLIQDEIETPSLLAVFFAVIAGLEWWRYYSGFPPSPWLFTIVALVAGLFAAFKLRQTLPVLRRLRLASDGEQAVAEFLDRLREHGYHVFHDLVGDNFNIDHVLVGPAGVFTIETKTRSKPMNREARVRFDGTVILIDGTPADRDPVVQAKAQARWLKLLLSESAGKQFPVWPVVLFPGWYVESSRTAHAALWVLEPKALPAFLAQEPSRLAADDVALASFHLSRFIRSGASS